MFEDELKSTESKYNHIDLRRQIIASFDNKSF